MVDEGMKVLNLQCGAANFHIDIVIEILRYLVDLSEFVRPKQAYPLLSSHFQKEIRYNFTPALSVWHVVCMLELIGPAQNTWVRQLLVNDIETSGVSPSQMGQSYDTLWGKDTRLIDTAKKIAAYSWTSKNLKAPEVEVIKEIRVWHPELWVSIRDLMNAYRMDEQYAQRLIGVSCEADKKHKSSSAESGEDTGKGVYSLAGY